MPKAKIDHAAASSFVGEVSRTPVKIKSTATPLWYMIIMFALMLLGLGWLVLYYLVGEQIQFLVQLGPWNYLVGFGLFIIGLLMTMGWK